MNWFYLALLAPLLYAIVNLIDDNLLQFVFKGPYLATAMAGLFSSLPLISLTFKPMPDIPMSLILLSVTAGFLTTLFYFFYFKALGSESPSIVIALFGLVPATLPFLAHYFLGEQLVRLEIIGFVIVLIASLGLAATDIKKFKFSDALVPALVGVVLLDIVSLLTKHVYQNTTFYPAYMYYSLGLGIGGVYFLFIMFYAKSTRDFSSLRRVFKKVLPVLILSELIALAAVFTSNLAIDRGPVSVVRVVEGIQPMYVLLIALIFYPLAPKYFREATHGHRAQKFLLMSLIVVGLVLINISIFH